MEKITQQQGRQANSNGKFFEEMIQQMLISRGYQNLKQLPNDGFGNPFFISQLKGKFYSIYDSPLKVDFYIWHPVKFPDGGIIECKYQETSGTADEKFPYVIANMRKANVPSVLLVIGSGAKKKAVEWCESQHEPGRLLVFKSMESFMKQSNKGLF